ncbi:MAG: TRAP transporter substrate-binding protein DctP [Spirochaetes bacterium]|nr:TRAP transporter substrate-binding protein DctP [Spirochaetota bacterium]
MKRTLILTLVAAIAAGSAAAAPIVIKIGSIAPENTPWGEELNKLAGEWSRISKGQVKMVVYHNGTAGDEPNALRQLKLGQLQGCVFTSFGLAGIAPEFFSLSAPFLIANEEELDYIVAKNRGYMEGLLAKQGIRTLAWSKAGWVRFFSKSQVRVPDDMKKLKLATEPGATTLLQAFKELGYHMVPVALPDTLVALNSGMIEAVYTSPLTVGGMQLFGIAKYMMSLRLSPFLGAIVISEKAWKRIPAELQPLLAEATHRTERILDERIGALEDEAIATMKEYGLVVTETTPEEKALWLRDVEISMPKAVGVSFNKEMYDLVSEQLKAYRSGKK